MPRVTELYAFVMADTAEDDEGVPAFAGKDGVMYPMMGADSARVDSLRDMAESMAKHAGKPIKIMRSVALEIVDVIEP